MILITNHEFIKDLNFKVLFNFTTTLYYLLFNVFVSENILVIPWERLIFSD